ncbi:MAG: hypothetical protein LBE57_03945 [Methanosarcinales archaeon]|jgi:hypothetical protein|nr:hypothetical protein [Methanosarcinales archaeon]
MTLKMKKDKHLIQKKALETPVFRTVFLTLSTFISYSAFVSFLNTLFLIDLFSLNRFSNSAFSGSVPNSNLKSESYSETESYKLNSLAAEMIAKYSSKKQHSIVYLSQMKGGY